MELRSTDFDDFFDVSDVAPIHRPTPFRLSVDGKFFPATPVEKLAAKLEQQRIAREANEFKREALERDAQWWDPRRRS